MSGTIHVDELTNLRPFADVARDRLSQLLPLCHRERFSHQIDPFRQRDWRGQILYLLKGELKVVGADGTTRLFVGGADRALFPVAQSGQMPVAGRAITDIELLRLDEEASDIVLTWDQCVGESGQTSGETTDWRSMSGMFAVQTLTQGAFAALPPAHIGELLHRFRRISKKRGDVVLQQGEPGDFYYLIERGRCSVTREVTGSVMELAELKAGDAFGEEALVADTVRNATVTMRTDGVLLALSKADFLELLRAPLLQSCPVSEAMQRIARGAVWLDVRFAAEYAHDGLPGASNVPLNELRQALPLLDRSKEYVVYCQSGRRSAAATFLLSQRGFNAVLLAGGLRAFGEVAPTGT